MLNDKIQTHYQQEGGLLAKIQQALELAGKSAEQLTPEDLSAVDEFHTGGRVATKKTCSKHSTSMLQ